jgi:hypothetical protein
VTEPEEPATPARKLSTRAIVIIAAIALVVLAGAGVGIYFLTKGSDTPAASSSSTQGGAPANGGGQAPAGSSPNSGGQTPAGGGGGAQASDVNGAKTVADKVVAAMNTHDAEARKKISCDPNSIGDADNLPTEVRAEVVSVPELTGDSATVELKLTIGDTSSTTLLPLRKQNGAWCAD